MNGFHIVSIRIWLVFSSIFLLLVYFFMHVHSSRAVFSPYAENKRTMKSMKEDYGTALGSGMWAAFSSEERIRQWVTSAGTVAVNHTCNHSSTHSGNLRRQSLLSSSCSTGMYLFTVYSLSVFPSLQCRETGNCPN